MSPGSRSTPLAYAFASTESVKMHRQIDERAAAFYALLKLALSLSFYYVHPAQQQQIIFQQLLRRNMLAYL